MSTAPSLPSRVAEWKARRVLALRLYGGPIPAQYAGELADRIGRVLDADPSTRRQTPWSAASALSIARSLEADGLVKIEGTKAKPLRVTWIGAMDPSTMTWHEEPERPPSKTSLLEQRVVDLEATVMELKRRIDADEVNFGKNVRHVLREMGGVAIPDPAPARRTTPLGRVGSAG